MTHEKTRLIELLTSGDKLNILLAKEICEQQDRMYIVREVLDNELLPKSVKDAIYCFGFGVNKHLLQNEEYIKDVIHVYYLERLYNLEKHSQA